MFTFQKNKENKENKEKYKVAFLYNHKKEFTYEERLQKSAKLIHTYHERVPVIIQKNMNQPELTDIEFHKYLIPKTLLMSDFVCLIRKKIALDSKVALFFFVSEKNILVPNTFTMEQVYMEHHDADGFLYFQYSAENTFG
jgi:GABA(A) receptor-associated protein